MPTPSSSRTIILQSEMDRAVTDFNSIRLKLASPDDIREASYGEVTMPETMNYRTQKPERDGLFGENIFGPTKDWQCACGKYKKVRYRGIICDRCGVEVTRSLVRRERMGHIELASTVTHIWYLKGAPSKIGLLLDISAQAIEKVVYFANFIITDVDITLKAQLLHDLEEELKNQKKEIKKMYPDDRATQDKKISEISKLYSERKKEVNSIKEGEIISESAYHEFSMRYGHLFSAGIGAEAVFKLLKKINTKELERKLEEEKQQTTNPTKRHKLSERLKLVKNFLLNHIEPSWMIVSVLPVIPPDLRPIVQLDGGRFASSDLNDLYRRVINRNNRLKKLINLNAPDIILRNEKRMLQEAVDSLLDNDMRSGKTVVAAAGQKRPLKSLADILKGKQGRFRQNLLGKRVDYSARSVIVVGPYLKLYQCGLPKIMAIELFRPFVISQLIKRELVHNVRSANRFIEGGSKEVWDILEEIVNKSLVLLNRAPTLHRLSIQAFQPVLIEGKAIQIHPLVCTAFNADFDGDQMAVHLPISERAQEEARTLMLASKNLLKPANGYPIVNPTKDIVWGVYYLTHIDERLRKSDADIKVFSEAKEALFVYQSGRIAINEPIKIREDGKFIETSIGRIIFRSALPEGLYALDKVVDSKELSEIINECTERYGSEKTAELVDDIKELGYHSITLSGLSWGFKDLPGLPEKEDMIKKAEQQIVEVQEQIGMGLLTADEAYQKNVEIWMATKRELDNIAMSKLDPYSPVSTMVKSGARGSKDQLTQIFSMRGLVGSPSGKLIDVPVKSSFREGLNALEYFISSHGSRKGTSDTALRTASAGYLTRRMVDVAQEVIITEEDCGDTEGFLFIKDESPFQEPFVQRLAGRFILDDIIDPSDEKKILVKKGSMVAASFAKSHKDLPISKIRIRSPLTCKTNRGICAVCYGTNLAYNKKVEIGTPVGVIGAQSIGEPGTQLVLRTFHTGGVAGRDITQGLPRVEELLEVRPPKNRGYLVPVNGKIKIIEKEKSKIIQLFYKDKKEEQYAIKKNSTLFVKDGDTVAVGDKIIEIDEEEIVANHAGTARIVDATVSIEYTDDEMMEFEVVGHKKILVKDGDEVKRGTQLSDGDLDLHELYTLRSKEEAQRYILSELKYIYAMQGQRLNDRHIEVIVRQMFSRVLITDGGDTEFLNDEVISRSYFNQINAMIKEKGKRAVGEELLLGITRSALSTESVLAAASFQETSRILINASISGRVDHLYGLKENVIIGRLIPAGTGFKKKP